MRRITACCALAPLIATAIGPHAAARPDLKPALVYMQSEFWDGYLTFDAGAYTANRVTVWLAGSDVHIRDAGGEVRAGPDCSQVTTNEVSYGPADDVKQLSVGLGDRDDSFSSSFSVPSHVSGHGDDRLSGYYGVDLQHCAGSRRERPI